MSKLLPPVNTPGNIGLNPYRLKRTNRLESAAARIKKKISVAKTKKIILKNK